MKRLTVFDGSKSGLTASALVRRSEGKPCNSSFGVEHAELDRVADQVHRVAQSEFM